MHIYLFYMYIYMYLTDTQKVGTHVIVNPKTYGVSIGNVGCQSDVLEYLHWRSIYKTPPWIWKSQGAKSDFTEGLHSPM